MKTFKGNYSNVCGVTLYYNVRLEGTSTNNYQSINLPYKAGCNGINFSDGYGPCTGNDQKWSTQSSFISLFDYAPGDYILDLYYVESGSSNHTDRCNESQNYDYRNLSSASTKFHILPRSVSTNANKNSNNAGLDNVAASQNAGLNIYPNPVNNMLHIDANNFENGVIEMQVNDIQGVHSKNSTTSYIKGQAITLDMSGYAAGIYFVRLQQGSKIAMAKIIKQ